MKKSLSLSFILMLITQLSFSQNVGIGITSPDERLHVDSVIRIGKNNAISTGTPGRKNLLKFGDGGYTSLGEELRDDKLYARFGDMVFMKSSGSTGNGFIGIQVDTPTANLDLSGTLRIRNGAAAGSVLTGDANGNATWQTPAPVNTSFLSSSEFVTFASGASVKVPYTITGVPSTVNFDDFHTFNSSTHAFTVPVTGVYHYDATVRLVVPGSNVLSGGNMTLRFAINNAVSGDVPNNTFRILNLIVGQTIPLNISTSGLIPLTAGDVVEAYFTQSSGVSVDIFNNASSNFSMFRVK